VEALATLESMMKGIERRSTRFSALHEAGAQSDDLIEIATDKPAKRRICVDDYRPRSLNDGVRDEDTGGQITTESADQLDDRHMDWMAAIPGTSTVHNPSRR
jgi:hypothetical protein